MQSNKRQRQPGELDNKLNNQMWHLFRSCRAFDAGQEIEAERIALTLRVLLHHNPSHRSHALLAQLNLLNTMQFVDSGVRRNLLNQAITAHIIGDHKFIAGGSPADTGLVTPVIVNGIGKFIAPLRRNRFVETDFRANCIVPYREFKDWWETSFIETLSGREFSRKDIVMTMANQDGGGHVDPEIDAEFSDFCQDSHGLALGTNYDDMEPIEANIVHATIRQIAFEVMATLDDAKGTTWVETTGNIREKAQWFPQPAYMIAYRPSEQ